MFFADDTDLLRIRQLLDRRARNMVTDAMAEGKRRADAYISAGGRKRKAGHSGFGPGGRISRHRRRRATGNQIARMTEKVLHYRFVNFWNPGW